MDDGHQVIMATGLDASAADTGALLALVDQIETDTGRRPKTLLADVAYASDCNLGHLEAERIGAISRSAAATTARPHRHHRGTASRRGSRVRHAWIASSRPTGAAPFTPCVSIWPRGPRLCEGSSNRAGVTPLHRVPPAER